MHREQADGILPMQIELRFSGRKRKSLLEDEVTANHYPCPTASILYTYFLVSSHRRTFDSLVTLEHIELKVLQVLVNPLNVSEQFLIV